MQINRNYGEKIVSGFFFIFIKSARHIYCYLQITFIQDSPTDKEVVPVTNKVTLQNRVTPFYDINVQLDDERPSIDIVNLANLKIMVRDH